MCLRNDGNFNDINVEARTMTTSHDYSNIKENFKVAREMTKKKKARSPEYRKGKSRNLYSIGELISEDNWNRIFK